MNQAIGDGAEIFGHCPWSATDPISSHDGFRNGMASFMSTVLILI